MEEDNKYLKAWLNPPPKDMSWRVGEVIMRRQVDYGKAPGINIICATFTTCVQVIRRIEYEVMKNTKDRL